MSGRVTICCVALFLSLSFVSAVQRIFSIDDLHRLISGRSVPEHSLVLLRWFANAIEIDSNNDIWLNFDPNQGDYGSHYYGNYEELLNWPTQGHRYYTIGNLKQRCPVELPPAVINHRSADRGRNRARIIVSVQWSNAGRRLQRIDRVYITQHYEANQHGGNMREYDPYHTYKISMNLLRDLRQNRWINVVLICVFFLLAFFFILLNLSQTKGRWY